MNLGILNTVIAMVIVFLVLSLIVQSVQMFVKKILKLKSNQIIDSLEDLYEQAIETTTVTPAPTAANGNKSPAKVFTDRVVGEFKKIGRVTYFGNPVLDSLSKEDLFKIMAKLESENFVPDYAKRFQALVDELNNLRKAIETLAANNVVKGVASAKLAEIRAVLAPIFNDVQSIVDGGSKVKARVLFGDLLRLGKLKPGGVLELLTEAQKAITSEIEVASKTDPGSVGALQSLSNELSKIATLIGGLSQKFDDAFAPLRGKLEQVETWYDTVMQGFDERYTRHMKTVALCISIVVVIVLNANFFKVYSSLSTNEVKRNLVLESGEKVLDAARKANPTPKPTPKPGPSPDPSPAAPANVAEGAQTSSSPTPTPTPSPSPSPTPDIKKLVDETQQDIDVYLSSYQEFGFAPLTVDDVNSWFWSIWKSTLLRNEKGVPVNEHNLPIPSDCREQDKDGRDIAIDGKRVICTAAWRAQTWAEWRASRRHDVFVLFGWTIMVLLLSVGAPFWQDTLESLFGVKNLLRQKSGTQNIETQSGTGQTKG
ncbi:MAG: OadG family protein [Pyrinomonadaceae bacterium]|nr:OadG family protein [Pyrinomonadaceae bacterium]